MARLFSDRGEATRALDELSRRSLNYDVADPNGFTVEGGWRIDHYHQALPAEQPGPPAADGAWATARGLLRDYEFIDPSIVRASSGPTSRSSGETCCSSSGLGVCAFMSACA